MSDEHDLVLFGNDILELEAERDEARAVARRLLQERNRAAAIARGAFARIRELIAERDENRQDANEWSWRSAEAKRQHTVTLERIANIALEAALTDGAHHKQWYLEKIMAECGAPVQRWHKAHQWQVGIAP